IKKKFKLDVHSTTIGRLIKNKDDIGNNFSTKRQRTVQYPELENSLLELAIQVQKQAWIGIGILPDAQNNEEQPIDDNNDDLMNELYKNIEVLNFLNVIDLEEYIDYLGEKDTHEVLSDQEILDLTTNIEPAENKCSKNENDSTEMREIGHQEALNAIEILEQYIVQKDFGKTAQSEHNEALSKLQKEIRKL
ncbi:39753_t:CDS:2, partial [Gigaspora margarita]